ncbi:MAG TPA: nitronate monooxygenase family protein [Beijerinckiaceae bacterium]|jgi:nitronate monooxygenase
MWPDTRLLDLLGVEHPIIQAPMAGAVSPEMVIRVSEAGGLGSLPCAMLTPDQARNDLGVIRQRTSRPINLNFFCHTPPRPDPAREGRWRDRLRPYYAELGLDADAPNPAAIRSPFDDAFCRIVEELKPEVVSFHFGLPAPDLLQRVKATGARVLSSANSVREARWLEERGCDAIIAQGLEAGGHQAMFLSHNVNTQVGTMALVPQVADAVKVPVIAAGGIADGRGIAAAFALDASGVQIGTAYLLCPEATIRPVHRDALRSAHENETALTNVFTGRPARGIMNRAVREIGPISDAAPDFPLAATALAPLRAKAEAAGQDDFTSLWAGQAFRLAKEMSAGDLTAMLARDAQTRLERGSAHG